MSMLANVTIAETVALQPPAYGFEGVFRYPLSTIESDCAPPLQPPLTVAHMSPSHLTCPPTMVT